MIPSIEARELFTVDKLASAFTCGVPITGLAAKCLVHRALDYSEAVSAFYF